MVATVDIVLRNMRTHKTCIGKHGEGNRHESPTSEEAYCAHITKTGIYQILNDDIYRRKHHYFFGDFVEYIEIPDFPVLRGKKAIEALCELMKEFEEQRGKELTDAQTEALVNLVAGLISTIEVETQPKSSRLIRRYVSEPVKRLFS